MISVFFGRGVFRVEGHARSAPKGEDLVCAAVSALAQALLHGLIEVAGCRVEVTRVETGLIDARWDETTLNDEGRAIRRTFEEAFREIALRNDAHLRVERIADGTGLPGSGRIV